MTVPALLILSSGVFLQVLLLYWFDRVMFERIADHVSWWAWRRWTLKRLYRQAKSFLLIRVLSSHMFAAKTVFALAIVSITVLLTPDNQNAVLTGATVFYATALYLNDRFEYPAIYVTEIDVFESRKEDIMGDVFTYPTITNQGGVTAEDLTARIRVVDPSRGCSTHWFYATSAGSETEKADAPLSVRRTREIQLGFDSGEEELSRLQMDDCLGDEAWIEIEIDTPDQLTSTWVYKALDGEFIDNEDFIEGLEAYTDHLTERINALPGTDNHVTVRFPDDESEIDPGEQWIPENDTL